MVVEIRERPTDLEKTDTNTSLISIDPECLDLQAEITGLEAFHLPLIGLDIFNGDDIKRNQVLPTVTMSAAERSAWNRSVAYVTCSGFRKDYTLLPASVRKDIYALRQKLHEALESLPDRVRDLTLAVLDDLNDPVVSTETDIGTETHNRDQPNGNNEKVLDQNARDRIRKAFLNAQNTPTGNLFRYNRHIDVSANSAPKERELAGSHS